RRGGLREEPRGDPRREGQSRNREEKVASADGGHEAHYASLGPLTTPLRAAASSAPAAARGSAGSRPPRISSSRRRRRNASPDASLSHATTTRGRSTTSGRTRGRPSRSRAGAPPG